MNRKCLIVVIYDHTVTTPSRLLHVVGNGEGVVNCKVKELKK